MRHACMPCHVGTPFQAEGSVEGVCRTHREGLGGHIALGGRDLRAEGRGRAEEAVSVWGGVRTACGSGGGGGRGSGV